MADPGVAATARQREMWAAGDFPRVARQTVAQFGPALVRAAGIGPGQRVLDLAAGSGTVAVPAAQAGANVVAADLTPELFVAGRAAAAAAGVEISWVEADAQALPFADGEFDAVVSSMGVMFAPDHERAAAELLRVCRPGGRIALISGAPGGWLMRLFTLLAPYGPPPPEGFRPPLFWGQPQYLAALLGDRVRELDSEPHVLEAPFESVDALLDFYKANFGPVVMAYRHIGDDAERRPQLDRALELWATEMSADRPDGSAAFRLEYLLSSATLAG